MSEFNIEDILRFLPHRYPFLLLDRVLEFDPHQSIKALKNVTVNEPFFQGHFPTRRVMPGVLILEALAQATGFLALKSLEKPPTEKSIYYFVGIDKARFRHPVIPGDQLILSSKLIRASRGVLKVSAEARVDGKLVASAELMGALREVGE